MWAGPFSAASGASFAPAGAFDTDVAAIHEKEKGFFVAGDKNLLLELEEFEVGFACPSEAVLRPSYLLI